MSMGLCTSMLSGPGTRRTRRVQTRVSSRRCSTVIGAVASSAKSRSLSGSGSMTNPASWAARPSASNVRGSSPRTTSVSATYAVGWGAASCPRSW